MLPGRRRWHFPRELSNDPSLASILVLVISAALAERPVDAKDASPCKLALYCSGVAEHAVSRWDWPLAIDNALAPSG